MGACAKLTYNKFTPKCWECCVEMAKKHYGIDINKPSGETSKDGFTIRWEYYENTQTLSIQCTHSPFWVSCGTINGRIDDEIMSCLKQHDIEMTDMLS